MSGAVKLIHSAVKMIHYGSCSVLVIHAEVVIEFENRLEFVIWSCVR